MPTGILLNGRSFRWSKCSLADETMAKACSDKKFLVSGLRFRVVDLNSCALRMAENY